MLNLILNPRFGVWGAVWATVAAGLVVLVINYVYGQKILFVNYRWPQILLLSALYLTIVIMFLTFPILNVFAYKTIAITIFGGAIIVTGVISYTQIKLGFGFLMNRIGNLKVVSFGK